MAGTPRTASSLPCNALLTTPRLATGFGSFTISLPSAIQWCNSNVFTEVAYPQWRWSCFTEVGRVDITCIIFAFKGGSLELQNVCALSNLYSYQLEEHGVPMSSSQTETCASRWIDCDTAVLDTRVSPQRVLTAAFALAGAPLPSFVASYEVWGRVEAAAHGTGFFHPVNTGSFFVRNGAWARAFLARWEDACFSRQKWMLWDQDALASLEGFKPPPLQFRQPWRMDGGHAVALPNAPFNTQATGAPNVPCQKTPLAALSAE
eukprot:6211756-Pleurochrysis_carterae.AAC.2